MGTEWWVWKGMGIFLSTILFFLRSVAVSMFPFGGMFGGISVGWFADKLGRKQTLLYNNAVSKPLPLHSPIIFFHHQLAIIAAALMTMAKYVGNYWLFIVGRFFIGLNAGDCFLIVKLYKWVRYTPIFQDSTADLPQCIWPRFRRPTCAVPLAQWRNCSSRSPSSSPSSWVSPSFWERKNVGPSSSHSQWQANPIINIRDG